MITVAINYTLARPNEHFLGYVDGKFYTQCRCADASATGGQERETGDILAADQSFTDLVGSVTKPVGRYEQPQLGER